MFLIKYRQFLEGGLDKSIYIYISIPWIQNLGRINIECGISHKTQNTHTSKIHIIKSNLPLQFFIFNRKVMLLHIMYNITALCVFILHKLVLA
jgi:hypothetical protein